MEEWFHHIRQYNVSLIGKKVKKKKKKPGSVLTNHDFSTNVETVSKMIFDLHAFLLLFKVPGLLVCNTCGQVFFFLTVMAAKYS